MLTARLYFSQSQHAWILTAELKVMEHRREIRHHLWEVAISQQPLGRFTQNKKQNVQLDQGCQVRYATYQKTCHVATRQLDKIDFSY